jgi:hypothetical protein
MDFTDDTDIELGTSGERWRCLSVVVVLSALRGC